MDPQGLEPPPRTVLPRQRTYKRLPVVALSGDSWLDENGETGNILEILSEIHVRKSTLFVKLSAADFIAELDTWWISHPHWQWRATINERDIIAPNGVRVASRISTAIYQFGFKGGYYHKIIDPVTMYGHGLNRIWPGDDPRIVKLLHWGMALRDFCDKNGLEIRPTIGSIGAQFLTDRRFYPKKRRKVPMAINERARERLPGNYYLLSVVPSNKREFRGWYLDQHRAHHYHARTVRLPNANSLFAYGFFTGLEKYAFDHVEPDFHGLYCVDLKIPHSLGNPRWWDWIKNGERVFVYSNELPHLYDSGYKVKGVYAAWGSRQLDTGLAQYAKWADKQLTHYGDATWLKPLLLSTYGTLATRPRDRETVFRLAKHGEPVKLVTGNNSLSGIRVRSPRKLEPAIANVLHRGMIEAGTRSESVGLAQWLMSTGYRPLAIYADAVIVEDDGTKLPLLPEPWRCKTTLNHLQFINQQAFVSGEMTKLPGVSQEARRHHLPLGRAL